MTRPKPKDLEKLKEDLQKAKEDAKNNYFEIRKSTIVQISNKIIDRLSEVHTSYSLMSQLLNQLDEIILFVQPIRVT